MLTLSGRDRPGIVVALTHSLFEAGCHIEDCTMTRLRNELVMMLLLRPPSILPLDALRLLLDSMANS
ncbi:MAG: amino acid-binding protein, partial [Magnetococcales bacterium]|nr:amino acid-binding protein [Magnetococcales bacterium]